MQQLCTECTANEGPEMDMSYYRMWIFEPIVENKRKSDSPWNVDKYLSFINFKLWSLMFRKHYLIFNISLFIYGRIMHWLAIVFITQYFSCEQFH